MTIRIMMSPQKHKPLLVLVTGPTAVGKTTFTIHLARELRTHIISADARQFYKELQIGTAAPTKAELESAPHHFIGHLSIHDDYNAAKYASDALNLLNALFTDHPVLVLTGGSGLYIDTLLHGIDDLPDPDPEARQEVKNIHALQGIEGLRRWLRQVDPQYYEEVDRANPNRMMRAIETFLTTGEKFSALRQSTAVDRPFHTLKVILNRPRQELFDRINLRTIQMLRDGLVEEAWDLFPYRHHNALNTVGYKEIYAWLSGVWPLSVAVNKIQTHTRRYAKRQITWFKRYDDAHWCHPEAYDEIVALIRGKSALL